MKAFYYIFILLILISCKKDILLEEKGLQGHWTFNQVTLIDDNREIYNQPTSLDNVSIDIAEDNYAIWSHKGEKHKGFIWEETESYTVWVDYEECWEEVEEIWIDDTTYYEESYTVCEWRTREETRYNYYLNLEFDDMQHIRASNYEMNNDYEIKCRFTLDSISYKVVLGREFINAVRRNP